MPDDRAPRIARALRGPDGDGDDPARAPEVVDADRDRPPGQLRRDEDPVGIEGVDDEVADGAASGEAADLVRRSRTPDRTQGRRARRPRRPGIAPIPTMARSREPNRSTVPASSGSRSSAVRRAARLDERRREDRDGRCRRAGRRGRGPARRHPGRDRAATSCRPAGRPTSGCPAAATIARTTAASVEPQAIPIASPSPIRPSRTAPARRGTSVATLDVPASDATATAHRSSPKRSSIAPASSRSSAGTSRYSMRTRPSARAPSMSRATRNRGDPEPGRDLDLAQLAVEEEPGDLGRQVGGRGGDGRHASDGRPRTSEMQPLICAPERRRSRALADQTGSSPRRFSSTSWRSWQTPVANPASLRAR